jgi:signal transduction histidine kinase/DNA-binding response OmpR family regulator
MRSKVFSSFIIHQSSLCLRLSPQSSVLSTILDDNISILVVDDKPEKVLAVSAVLEELGQVIVSANSGRDALRCVLAQEFAVILLDVNMPGMNGFETAQLIRQRRSTSHTPIIFITAFADEMQLVRGYSLGAVDYILAPFVPEVLRTKVGVFVELYRKTVQNQRQAELERKRAAQLQKLAAASLAINASRSLQSLMQVVADSARDIVGAHQAIALYNPDPLVAFGTRQTEAVGSFSEKYSHWRGRRLRLDACAQTQVARSRRATRMDKAQLRAHPDWQIVQNLEVPPIEGMLAAPLVAGDGRNMGVVYLSDRLEGHFTDEDEAILTQLAQMASIAIENSLFAEEREANRMKDEFLATLSHELRTPLNAILGWTQLLATERLNDEVSHGLEVIERNARAQTKLIEDLLDVSRITTGKLRLAVKPMRFCSVVEAAIDAVRPAAAAKQIALDIELDDGGQEISGDCDRLQQVVWNLLSNAVKFTPVSGRVEVNLRREGAHLRLRVSDTGRGISPEFLPHVFDRFRQADSTSTRAHGGLGIGLAIVRHIIELHGGSVQAQSPGEGLGASFVVDLPIMVDEESAMPAPMPAKVNGEHVSSDGDRTQATSVDLAGLHVLVVDDEPDAREIIAQMLHRSGAKAALAGSVREALDALERMRVDVLVSDIAMPDRDGYELIRLVRDLPASQGGRVPAIALTAYAREEDRFRALTAGFQAHLAKPVTPADLTAAVAQAAAMTPHAEDVRA